MDKQPQEVNLERLNLEKLIEFIDELREADYQIGTSQYIAVQNLILTLIAQGDNLDRPQRFKTLLSPLLCHSPTEQEDFYQRFDQWLKRMGFIVNNAVPIDTKAEELRQVLRKLKNQERKWWWFAIIALLAFVGVLFVRAMPFQPKLLIAKPSIFQTSKPIPLQPKPSIPQTSKPTPLQPKPSILQTSKPTDKSQVTQWQLIVLVLFLPVFIFFVWQFWWSFQAYRFLARHSTNQQPELEEVSIAGLDEELFPKVLFLHIAQDFRRRIPISSHELNVKKTVEKSVQLGGYFTPVYSYRQLLPEYLVLIDRTNYNDHQARFAKEIIDRLSQNQVSLIGYYFDSDPRVCFPMTGKGTPLTLYEIARKYSHYRLILFTDAEGLFSSRTGELESWNHLFTKWSDRAILTPKPSEHWGYQELELSWQFAVLPATSEGLINLVHSTKYEELPYTPSENFRAPFPEILRVRSRRWIERDPPESLLIDEVLKSLQGYLGESGYRWLSACAIFPQMHWNLTLYLGYNLSTKDESTLLQDSQITDLARLPWFRDGYMPDWLRIRLISEIPRPEEQKIRLAIEALLVTSVQGSVGFLQLEIAKKNVYMLSMLAQPLLRLLAKKAPKDSLLKDYIFQEFMAGRQKKLAVRMRKASRNVLSSKRTQWRLWLQWFLVTTLSQAFGWGVGWLGESIIMLTLSLAFSGVIAGVIQLYILILYVPEYVAKSSRWILASWILTNSISRIGLLFAVIVAFVKTGTFAGEGSVALALTITGAVVLALGVALAGSGAVAFSAVLAAVLAIVLGLIGALNLALIVAVAGGIAIAGVIVLAITGPIAKAIAQALNIAQAKAEALDIVLAKAEALAGAGILTGAGILALAGILSGDRIGILAGVIILAGVKIIQSQILDGILNQTVSLYGVWTLSGIFGDAVSCLAIPVAYGVTNFIENYVSTSVAKIAFGATLGTGSGIVSGAITGTALFWLLRKRQ
ncbi:MAG: Trp biosynthesis-associated membrane protein [Nostoc sp. EfeVER01]|uniref:Trp biosynthesis-associated membrane protein n=1 Tax=unclassified Nostoc TaxID=2593658 RepID=UPI002AD5917C|nr:MULTISPECIES: Trp biosynthesis-associated membrane protein [unclassified Nostoc]MDZ7945695.1 Trp biosynthesis-associated membrane protein [Nostoc sp. EfeVER01]MDZ7995935.1 Trp biosynthesis-associated membrane protein [Nostoc sp. EspVER01]